MARGQTGIGSLLIFLAMIVVAVLAATVFITTASNLQQKAFAVGSEAKERVSATFDVESITGIQDGTNRTIHDLAIVVRLAPGASPVKFDDEGTILQILTPEWQVLSIKYNGTISGSGVFPNVPTTDEFYVWTNESVNRDNYWNILSPGELYTLVIALAPNYTITEEMPVTVKIISRTGISTTIRFRAPTVIEDPVVQLYP